MSKSVIRVQALAFGALYALCAAPPVLAAPGTLSTAPLFATATVQPNIFMTVDDSGSMDWAMMTTEADGLIYLGTYYYFYTHPAPDNTYFWTVATEEYLTGSKGIAWPAGGAWRAWYAGYNALYYDPAVTYTPWRGVDKLNVAYANASPTAARYNAWDSAVGTMNLTATTSYSTDYPGYSTFTVTGFYPARYYTWTDSDGDGVVDDTDAHTLVEIKSATPTYTGGPSREDCAAAPTCTYAEEIQNFANWFQYYRKRISVAKRAFTEVVNDSTARMGLATINNNNGLSGTSVGTQVKSVDDISAPVSATNAANKSALLSNVAKIRAAGSTPLRTALNRTGKYFEGITGDSGSKPLFGVNPSPASPILASASGGECQQNFTLLMTDGFWNDAYSGVGNTDTDGAGAWDGQSYADGYSDTLADVAMNYYERDLATSLTDKVPVLTGVDEAPHQHMVTYGIGFGVNGTLTANPTDPEAAFTWPFAVADSRETIDDLRHAAWNGRGSFLNSRNPDTLIDALEDAISDLSSRLGVASAVAFNSTNLRIGSLIFQARFNASFWSGELDAYEIGLDTDGKAELTLEWSAHDLLSDRDLDADPRTVITYNGTKGIPFAFPAAYNTPTANELSTNQIKDLLAQSPKGYGATSAADKALNQSFGTRIVNYLRGDFTNEKGGTGTKEFRFRGGNRLGDVVQSGPVYVGAPDAYYPETLESTAYSTFLSAKAGRPERVYAGGNDGGLHAFDAASGKEMMFYLPQLVFDGTAVNGVGRLAQTSYTHRYYVDLTPTVGDVFIKGFGASKSWHTVLVGGLRGGGNGLFVLDITDGSFSESSADDLVLFEYTDTNLGYTYSKPQIARMADGSWVAIFGNGYNANGDGKAKLYILDLDTKTAKIIDTGVGSKPASASSTCTSAGADCNGLATPALVDLNGDAIIDRVYAGDLKGNLWAFDVSSSDKANWKSAYTSGGAGTPKPLFVAKDGTGGSANVQPITVKPAIARHPDQKSSSTSPNLMVYFGTGQYLVASDTTSTAKQTFYGVWDGGSYDLTRSNLTAQTITTATHTGTGTTVRLVSDNAVTYDKATAKHGWYMDLPTSGERVFVDATVLGDYVFFNTGIPSTDLCSGGGAGWRMVVDAVNGGEPDYVAVDVDGDYLFTSADSVGSDAVSGLSTVDLPTGDGFLIFEGGALRVSSTTSVPEIDAVQPTQAVAPRRTSWSNVDL